MHAMMKVGAANLLTQDVPSVKGTGAGAQFGDVLQNAIKQAADAIGKSEAVERKAAGLESVVVAGDAGLIEKCARRRGGRRRGLRGRGQAASLPQHRQGGLPHQRDGDLQGDDGEGDGKKTEILKMFNIILNKSKNLNTLITDENLLSYLNKYYIKYEKTKSLYINRTFDSNKCYIHIKWRYVKSN